MQHAKIGDVITLDYRVLRDFGTYFTAHDFLFAHNPWVVVRSMDPRSRSRTVRLSSLDGKVAMTQWFCLEIDKGEYVINPFLSAVYKASREKKSLAAKPGL